MTDKKRLEHYRMQARDKFNQSVRDWWIDCGLWALPHRTQWLCSQVEGQRNNRHIVDITHLLALRSWTAGFLEGNTSASRPWWRPVHQDEDRNRFPANRKWLDTYGRASLNVLSNSNFYHAAGQVYYDTGCYDTAGVYIQETDTGPFFHVLVPGSYYVINNNFGVATMLIREFSTTVLEVIETYAKKKDGKWDLSVFSSYIRKMYEEGNYNSPVDVVHIMMPNDHVDPTMPKAGRNRPWLSIAYEIGTANTISFASSINTVASGTYDPGDADKFLEYSYLKRKPFFVPKGSSSGTFPYGQKSPMLDVLGTVKSLNKKAVGKDRALEQIVNPTMMGAANLRRSYVTNAPGHYIPLDKITAETGGLKRVFEITPAIAALDQDVADLRKQVEKAFFSDFLLFLSMNPKTRTATETNAILQEQQLIIGPHLQSLNFSFNDAVVDWVMDYVLDTNRELRETIPDSLAGEFLRVNYISIFAQAQKAADLPSVNQYIQAMMMAGQINPQVFDKVNLDRYADIYEDRLFLPHGLNRPQNEVDAMREQAQMQAQRQQMVTEDIPAMAGAAKDLGLNKQ